MGQNASLMVKSEHALPFFSTHGDMTLRRAPRDEVPYAVFEGVIPSDAQRREILQRGFGLHLIQVPDNHRDLAFLRRFEGLTHLGIIGSELDTGVVSSMESLVALELSVAAAPETPLNGLARLRRFSGFFRPNESVLDAPSLRIAAFQDVGRAVLPPLPSQVEDLSVMDARAVALVTSESGSPALRNIVIGGSRVFDAASLLSFPRLEIVSLYGVGVVEHAEALLRLPLRELGLLNCRSVANIESLGALQNASVTVAGRGASAARQIERHPSSSWTFLPRT